MENLKEKSGLTKVAEGTMEYFEVTFKINQSDKVLLSKDPNLFVRKFLESHGQTVNGVILSASFIKELSKAAKGCTSDSPGYVRHVIAHVDAPKKYRSVHVSMKTFTMLPPIGSETKPKPGLRKFLEGTMEVFDATINLGNGDKELFVKNPAKYVKEFLESHDQFVNDVVLPSDFLAEAIDAIKKSGKDGRIQMSRPICHLGSPWWCWSRFIVLR